MKAREHAPMTRQQTGPRNGRRDRSSNAGPRAPIESALDESAQENSGVAHVALLSRYQAMADASAVGQAAAGYQDLANNSARVRSGARFRENRTGLPDNLKTGIERLSGLSMDNVRVHFNSTEPKKLNALAYTQGRDIHIGPGQERHLAHEAWHVVQQAQGRVHPTLQLREVAVNDDAGLEKEADAMGDKAASHAWGRDDGAGLKAMNIAATHGGQPVQRKTLSKDKLNVAGEDHFESDARRSDEEVLASTATEGGYWQEQEFMVDVNDETEAEADPNVLKFLTVLHDVTNLSRPIYDAVSETSCVTNAKLRDDLISSLIDLAERQYTKGVGVPYPSSRETPLTNVQMATRDNLLGNRYAALQELKTAHRSLAAMQDGSLTVSLKKQVQVLRTTMKGAAENMTGKLMVKPDLDFLRSMAMNRAAVKMVATKGLWKIGDAHVTDIKTKLPEDQPEPSYNLLTKEELNEIISKSVTKL